MIVRTFKVIEDNGGGLHLVIFNDKDVVYLHSGYEHNPGQLRGDIKDIYDPTGCGLYAEDEWNGNEEDPQDVYDSITEHEYGWKVIAEGDDSILIVYASLVGTAGFKELFGI